MMDDMTAPESEAKISQVPPPVAGSICRKRCLPYVSGWDKHVYKESMWYI